MHTPRLPLQATGRERHTQLYTPAGQCRLQAWKTIVRHSHAVPCTQTLAGQTRLETPTDNQTLQHTATCPVNPCRPAQILLGHTQPSPPSHVNKHWMQAQGHRVPSSRSTQITGRPRPIQVTDTPGNTSPPEAWLCTLDKPRDKPPSLASHSESPRGEQRQTAGAACVCSHMHTPM